MDEPELKQKLVMLSYWHCGIDEHLHIHKEDAELCQFMRKKEIEPPALDTVAEKHAAWNARRHRIFVMVMEGMSFAHASEVLGISDSRARVLFFAGMRQIFTALCQADREKANADVSKAGYGNVRLMKKNATFWLEHAHYILERRQGHGG